jgi:hypothetical protein
MNMWVASGGATVAAAAAGVYALYRYGPQRVSFPNSTLVLATPDETFATVTDFQRWPLYWGFDTVVNPPESPVGMGSRFEFREPNGTLIQATVTDWVPGERFGCRLNMAEEDLGQELSITLRGAAEGTRLDMVNEVRIGANKYRVLVPAMSPMLRYYFYPSALNRMKQAAEGTLRSG